MAENWLLGTFIVRMSCGRVFLDELLFSGANLRFLPRLFLCWPKPLVLSIRNGMVLTLGTNRDGRFNRFK